MLKARASKHAINGVLVSSVALIAATILSGYFLFREVSLEAFINAQKTNAVLWVLDGMPFLFALWGQYVSSFMVHEAGALVHDQTQKLRVKTIALESQAEHNANHDSLTGLPNRALFRERIEQALNSAKSNGKKLGVLLLDLDLQVSIGAAIFPEHGTGSDTLIQRADVARYVAKEGQNVCVIYSQDHDQHSPQRLTLMGELRKGVHSGELFLLYQPKVNGKDGRISSAEALVRWQHSKHGIIPPNEFIPIAERTGVIKDISMYVIKTVLGQIVVWQKMGKEISVSVNLSGQDLLDPKLPDVLAELLASYEVPASQLVLEITETAIIADPEMALQVMFRLSEMGVKLSIDDFGTGYSSLSYLKKMPVSEIKIDRSFVMEMMENSSDAVIVKATIGLAHNLGLEVVAEGVEDQESADHLKGLGCDTLQGFFFSKPIPPEEFIVMAGKSKDN